MMRWITILIIVIEFGLNYSSGFESGWQYSQEKWQQSVVTSGMFTNSTNSCQPNPCRHDNRCQVTAGVAPGYKCICDNNTAYDGPNCESFRRSILQGGYFMLQSDKIKTFSYKFFNLVRGEGRLFSIDQVAVEVKQGKIELYYRGTKQRTISPTTGITDDYWHQIDLIFDGNEIQLILDRCSSIENSPIGECFISWSYNAGDFFKNVFVGQPHNGIFDGCVKDIRINGKLHDLFIVSEGSATEPGCSREDLSCGITETDSHGYCGIHGTCVGKVDQKDDQATCYCDPQRWPGQKTKMCTNVTTPIYLNGSLAMTLEELDIRDTVHTSKIAIQIMLRTSKLNGSLIQMYGDGLSIDKVLLQLTIVNGHPVGKWTTQSDSVIEVRLNRISLSDGLWHTILFNRQGNILELIVDHGNTDDLYVLSSTISTNNKLILGRQMLIGSEDFEGCWDDLRINNKYFPFEDSWNVTYGCKADCDSTIIEECTASNTQCVTNWPNAVCQCDLENNKIIDINGSCVYDQCSGVNSTTICNNGNCTFAENNGTHLCTCFPGFQGPFCNILIPVIPPSTTILEWYWWLLIALLLLILLLLLLLLLFCCCGWCCCCGAAAAKDDDDTKNEILWVHGNLINYDIMGGGEEDFLEPINMDLLQRAYLPPVPPDQEYPEKPIYPRLENEKPRTRLPISPRDKRTEPWPWENPSANPRPDRAFDTPLEYGYEGDNPTNRPLSVSSVASRDLRSRENDFDRLKNWGPKFDRLSHLYNR